MTGSRPQPRDRAPWRAIDVNGSGAPGGPDRISCGTREGSPTRGMRRTSKTYATSPAALADACPSTARQRAGYRRSDDRTAANYAARFHPRRAVSARRAAYPQSARAAQRYGGPGISLRSLDRIIFKKERLTIVKRRPRSRKAVQKGPSLSNARLYSGSLRSILIAFVNSHAVESLNLLRRSQQRARKANCIQDHLP